MRLGDRSVNGSGELFAGLRSLLRSPIEAGSIGGASRSQSIARSMRQ
jgi:hypothetical protein